MGYRLKLTVTLSLLIALSFGIGGTVMLTTSFQSNLQQETQTAMESFETVQHTLCLLTTMNQQWDLEGLVRALTQMADEKMIRWEALMLASNGRTVFQNGKAALLMPPIPDENQCSYLSVSDNHGQGIVITGLIPTDSSRLQLTARFDVSAVYETRQLQQKQYLAIYIAVVAFGILTAAIFSCILTRPMKKLTKTAGQIAAGYLSQRSALTSQDEIGQLSQAFDTMADKLQANIITLEEEVQRQENFIGAFAHEMKTPMTSIIGFADLIRQGDLDEAARITAAEYIHSEGHRLERLSFQLLELVMLKKDEAQFQQVSLEHLVAQVKAALAPALHARNIRFICQAQQEIVYVEPDLIKSLLYNLVDNGANAIENEGVIQLDAAIIPGGCQFRVSDDGRGMEQDELSKITQAFYRVDKARSRSQGGAGLGLALCQQIAQLHNGTLDFSSHPGKGTCVTVTLYGKEGTHNDA